MNNKTGQPDVEEEVDRMASHLLARNMRAVKDATQAQANELASVRGSIADLQQTLNTIVQQQEQMRQLLLQGLVANKGTGPTS